MRLTGTGQWIEQQQKKEVALTFDLRLTGLRCLGIQGCEKKERVTHFSWSAAKPLCGI